MRSAGVLAGLEALQPGDHVCWVVDAGVSYQDVARRCLAGGRAVNDKVMAFGPEQALAWARSDDHEVVATDPHHAFLGDGPLRPETMFETFRRETAAARRQGYRGLRVVADMDWLLGTEPQADANELLDFELRLDEVVAELEATIVCAYRTATFGADDIARMRSVHPLGFGTPVDDVGFRIWHGGDGAWRVSGEIDFANAELFQATLRAVARPGAVLRLQLDELAFIDVAGMRALAAVAHEMPGLGLRLEDAPSTFRRCWDLLDHGRHLRAVEIA